MGKDKVEKEKKRAEKKEKRSEKDGVSKPKKEKKDKKDKAALADAVEKQITSQVIEGLEKAIPEGVTAKGEIDIDVVDAPAERPIGALVPFAEPLVEDKQAKKVLKSVKKAAVNKSLKRGVKEVVKALRKSPVPAPDAKIDLPNGIVILAADISPMDVISHLPVLCEDHGIPYVFVTSRAELGASAATKRPTSVVMVVREAGKKNKKDLDADADGEDFSKVYEELAKLVEKEAQKVNH
ncbi:L30e-like protein [Penicillium chermesinum]|uniref:L30e-like protein n=1 Tax=Penicillium chermesinum TaxID=63820 RepID=A0A9W9PIH7_9EURO|nr:L30e-like protein [Penicillium chermesinum]KAJ5247459.1 L30e-like protein [Penicillium chermesinum]KAJ6145697.1 L30e-like protein [Penicillium chermesinum]